MIYITNIWALPFAIALWAINTWLFLASLRLILGQLRSERAIQLSQSLAVFTDGIPNGLERWLSRRGHAIASWLPWAVVILVSLMARHALLRIIIAFA